MADSINGAGAASVIAWDESLPPAVRRLADELLPLFYADLKRLARRERARVGASGTLHTTALVHEAYLKLRETRSWNDESHFFRAAALAMRHALVNHAEARRAAKRGGGVPHLSLDQALEIGVASDEALLALDEALHRLARQSARLARVVECRFFAGFDERETARALGLSERTVRRDWTLARAWLYRELSGS
ncbi:MAG TPA: ECF-type sigma factor [Thermoanaerobaculia bacterium]|nr:ECF-type sigma factor [Thermoanaerobaculia bacterium]